MRIVNSSPGRVLRMVGALGPLQGEAVTGMLTITLKTTPKGTRILWEYVVGGYMRYKPDVIAPAVDGVLAEQLARLAVQLGGAPEAPAVPEGAKTETPPPASDAPAAAADAPVEPMVAAPVADTPPPSDAPAEVVPETPKPEPASNAITPRPPV
jgi:predicted lipid-binding transport protein (Tim44 family)